MIAQKLMLEFMDWRYRAPAPERAGMKRRLAREKAQRNFLAALYANTPQHPPSRQVLRYIARRA